ncbi:THAP domain-containing protein 2-like [Etheostoma cragini]|uniref:THAP domain-containing protein 2-like n=1 Tax=Etheostoma cragini TaxID=417921 RepID=UPI00155F079E|nr:THAP domain-containing protein 2-like [Etheostoma cragini]
MASRKYKYQRRQDSTSAEHCCVPLCEASSKFNSVLSFHTFPVDEESRRKWFHNIRRERFNITSHTRVCSRHFKSDDLIEPSTPKGRRLLPKGAVPTLFQSNDYFVAEPRRSGVWQRRDTQVDEVPEPMNAHYLEHDYCLVPEPAAVDNALDKTEDLEKKVDRLMRQVEELSVRQRFCLGRFAASDDDIRFYIRFMTYRHLISFWKLIEPASHKMIRVTRARATTMRSEAETRDSTWVNKK